MSDVILFKREDRVFETYGDDPAKASICTLVGEKLSSTMGAGIARFDGANIEWTVLYDELIVTLEGQFRIKVGAHVFEAGPGDVLWIPERTSLTYQGTAATVLYVLYPVDWKDRIVKQTAGTCEAEALLK